MIVLTTEDEELVMINENLIVAVTTQSDGELTEVYVGELCIPVKESVGMIINILQHKFN